MPVSELSALLAKGPEYSHSRSGGIQKKGDQSAISQEEEVKSDRPVSTESES